VPTDALLAAAASAADRLRAHGETVAVAEVSAGGLIAAALLAQDGASAYFRGGFVVYTLAGADAQLGPDASDLDRGDRGATEALARWLADGARRRLRADWGIGETGAAGPRPNPYGDPVGHTWVAAAGPDGIATARLRTGHGDRAANMEAFAIRALGLVGRGADGAG
jgi:PncC family amidohydrolase